MLFCKTTWTNSYGTVEANTTRPLLAGGIVHKPSQSVDICNPELSVALLENTHFRKAVEFAGHGLAVSARAARDHAR